MAAQAPRDGLEFVPGTMEEVGVELLQHVDDPQDVVAYGGYGFWAPAAAIRKVKGAKKQDLTNAPIAPTTAPYVDDEAYEDIPTDDDGQAIPGQVDADELIEANAPVADVGVGEKATKAKAEHVELPEKVSAPVKDVGVGEKAHKAVDDSEPLPEKVSAPYGETDGANPATEPEHDAANSDPLKSTKS